MAMVWVDFKTRKPTAIGWGDYCNLLVVFKSFEIPVNHLKTRAFTVSTCTQYYQIVEILNQGVGINDNAGLWVKNDIKNDIHDNAPTYMKMTYMTYIIMSPKRLGHDIHYYVSYLILSPKRLAINTKRDGDSLPSPVHDHHHPNEPGQRPERTHGTHFFGVLSGKNFAEFFFSKFSLFFFKVRTVPFEIIKTHA
jgi:hypothetical protein